MQQRRRGWLMFWVMLPWLLIILIFGSVIHLYNRPVSALAASGVAPADITTPAAALPWPAFGQASVGTVQDGLLSGTPNQTAVPTASTAKIMTALAVLKKKPLGLNQPGPTITITANDIAIYNKYYAMDGSLARVALGEQISQYQALQALLLPSANNFADTLVIWAFGSMDAYSAYANKLAAQLGMSQSHFADASGFSAETVSTANDLTRLAQAALREPVINQVVGLESAVIPVAGTIRNTNVMLGTNGIDGMKTGNTAEAGGAYIFSAQKPLADGHTTRVIGAVMKAPDLVSAMRAAPSLVTATAQGFVSKPAVSRGQVVGSYRLPWNGATVRAIIKQDAGPTVFGGTTIATKVKLDPLTGPRQQGDQVGTATITAGTQKIEVPVVLQESVGAPGTWYRLSHR